MEEEAIEPGKVVMNLLSKKLGLALVTCLLFQTAANAVEDPFTFNLRSHEGREWSDADFKEKDLVVVAIARMHMPAIRLGHLLFFQCLEVDESKDGSRRGRPANHQRAIGIATHPDKVNFPDKGHRFGQLTF